MKHPTSLCVITTHPIQYMAPWFRVLAEDPEIGLAVIFFRELDAQQQGVGFGQAFQWDVPLREGYANRVLDSQPGWRSLPGLTWRLWTRLAASRPDAVLITGWNEPGLMAAYLVARLMGIPVILRGEANALRPRSALKRLLHKSLLRLVAAVTVIGQANRRFYLDNGVPACRLFGGTYFVETDRMLAMSRAQQTHRAFLRQALGYVEKDFVFCFVGKHVPFKRPLLLVEAAAQVRANGEQVKLHFAGAGELEQAIRQRALELRVPVHFTGFLNQTEMWKAYVPADAFVLPSTHGETWGLVTNEAMLFGLPVIVSDQVGCAQDLVREGETGHVFAGGVEGLAQAMQAMLDNRDRANAMGARARQLVVDEYSMPVATAGLKAALEAACP